MTVSSFKLKRTAVLSGLDNVTDPMLINHIAPRTLTADELAFAPGVTSPHLDDSGQSLFALRRHLHGEYIPFQLTNAAGLITFGGADYNELIVLPTYLITADIENQPDTLDLDNYPDNAQWLQNLIVAYPTENQLRIRQLVTDQRGMLYVRYGIADVNDPEQVIDGKAIAYNWSDWTTLGSGSNPTPSFEPGGYINSMYHHAWYYVPSDTEFNTECVWIGGDNPDAQISVMQIMTVDPDVFDTSKLWKHVYRDPIVFSDEAHGGIKGIVNYSKQWLSTRLGSGGGDHEPPASINRTEMITDGSPWYSSKSKYTFVVPAQSLICTGNYNYDRPCLIQTDRRIYPIGWVSGYRLNNDGTASVMDVDSVAADDYQLSYVQSLSYTELKPMVTKPYDWGGSTATMPNSVDLLPEYTAPPVNPKSIPLYPEEPAVLAKESTVICNAKLSKYKGSYKSIQIGLWIKLPTADYGTEITLVDRSKNDFTGSYTATLPAGTSLRIWVYKYSGDGTYLGNMLACQFHGVSFSSSISPTS